MDNKNGKKEKVKKIFRDKELAETKHYSKRYAATVLSVISVVLCVASIVGFIWMKTYFRDTDAIKALVEENMVLGTLALILICAVQVVVAFIPGELVEIACGYVFGGFWGTVVCLTGLLLGSTVSILLARNLGRRFVESLYPREKIDALPVLRDPKKRNLLTFILFFIPGTPKDLFTYVIGLTDMSIPLYLLLTGVARLPSVIISTIGGDALGEDKLIHALVIFAIAGAVSLCGIMIYRAITKKQAEQEKKRKETAEKIK